MQYKILATKDNSEGQFNAGISASALSVILKSGEGTKFPQAKKGTATSAGSSTALNSTGIGAILAAAGVVVGDPIWNNTDGSSAWIEAINADDIVTSILKDGTGNDWGNSDVWVCNPFVLTANTRDSDGDILLYEEILIIDRATDTLTVETNGRGYNSTTAQEWDADDCANLLVTSPITEEMKKAISTLFADKAEGTVVVLRDGSQAMTGALAMGANKITGVADPTAAQDAMTKAFADANYAASGASVSEFGDGSDGALDTTGGAVNIALGTVKNYSSMTIDTNDLGVTGTNGFAIIKCLGNCVIQNGAKIDLAGKGGAGGATAYASGGAGQTNGNNGTNGDQVTLGGDGQNHNGNGGDAWVQSNSNCRATGGSGGAGLSDSTASTATGSATAAPKADKVTGAVGFVKFGNFVGSGGGSGAAATSYSTKNMTSGKGGNGGAGLILLVKGNLTLSTATSIDAQGEDGGNASGSTDNDAAGGGGGGGAGGGILLVHEGSLTGSTSNIDVTGGAKGNKSSSTDGVATDGTAGTVGQKLIFSNKFLIA